MISLVNDSTEGRAIIRQLIGEHGDSPGSRTILEKTYLKKTRLTGTLLAGDKLKLAIGQAAFVGVKGTAVVVNGKNLLYMNSKAEAEKLLDELKRPYSAKNGKTYFVEDVQLADALTQKGKIVSVARALDLVKNGFQTIAPYQVKEGDNLWDLAASAGLSVENVLAMNPDLNSEELKPGDSIKLTKTENLINVETVYNKVAIENIDYKVVDKQDSSLLKGQVKVARQGKEGKKEVTYKIVQKNGTEVARKQIAEAVIAEPENKVIARGTRNLLASRGGGRLMRPVSGPISSDFGRRGGRPHEGIDISGQVGTGIVAAEAGTVIRAGWYSGYGKCIDISHGSGVITRYGHLYSIDVSKGQVVSRGEFIGELGNTGYSSGPHLHFEVRVNGEAYNPLNFI